MYTTSLFFALAFANVDAFVSSSMSNEQLVISSHSESQFGNFGLLRHAFDKDGELSRKVSAAKAQHFQKALALFSSNAPSELIEDLHVRETVENLRANAPPLTFDLRDERFVTSVKDQGHCGSCVSFAMMATVESSMHKQTNKVVSLREEYDLSESAFYTCAAQVECSPGGMMLDHAISLVQTVGVQNESSLPYNSTDLKCNRRDSSFHQQTLKATTLTSIASIQEWMRQKGAVFTAFDVPTNFIPVLKENDGVYDYSGDLEIRGGHSVSCVGYDNSYVDKAGDHVGAWICKNSWGTVKFGNEWKDPGYFRVAFGQLGLMADAYGIEVSEEHDCLPGREEIDDIRKYDGLNADYLKMSRCDAAHLANEAALTGDVYDALDYLVLAHPAFETFVDCSESHVFARKSEDFSISLELLNDFEMARHRSFLLNGVNMKSLYESIGCRVIKN